jgi:hypothetical protein
VISIILAANAEAKERAKAAGFTEYTVLLRHEACMSTQEEKAKRENELAMEIRPFQFLVSDYWGMGNE